VFLVTECKVTAIAGDWMWSRKKPQTVQSCARSKKNICDFMDTVQREHSTRFIQLSRCYCL